MKTAPTIVIGPSGSGKSTLVDKLRNDPNITIGETVTTRPKRSVVQETDRLFVSDTEFNELDARGAFQFIIPYEGYRYGFLVPYNSTQKLVIIYKVQGMSILAQHYANFRVVAIEAPIEVLEKRLHERGTPERFKRSELTQEMTDGREIADLVIDTAKPLNECLEALRAFINN